MSGSAPGRPALAPSLDLVHAVADVFAPFTVRECADWCAMALGEPATAATRATVRNRLNTLTGLGVLRAEGRPARYHLIRSIP